MIKKHETKYSEIKILGKSRGFSNINEKGQTAGSLIKFSGKIWGFAKNDEKVPI